MNRELLKWIVFCSLILGVILFSVYNSRMIRKYGVITFAKVVDFESNSSGGDLYITIFYKNKEYKSKINSICKKCIGKYYFVKVLDRDPANNVLLLDDFIVPACILAKPIPYNGWKEIPDCD